MEKMLLVFTLATSLSFGNFFEEDSCVNIGTSSLVSFTASSIAAKNGFSRKESFLIGVSAAMLLSIVMVVYNKDNDSRVDESYILSNSIGSGIGSYTLIKIKF